jgi:hypothetical protein
VSPPRVHSHIRHVQGDADMTENRIIWPVLGVVAAVVIIIVLI